MPEEKPEKIIFRQVTLDGCPAEELDVCASHLYSQLEEKFGEPPSLGEAYRVGLITGCVHLMDALGIPHDYKEFSLVVDEELLDS